MIPEDLTLPFKSMNSYLEPLGALRVTPDAAGLGDTENVKSAIFESNPELLFLRPPPSIGNQSWLLSVALHVPQPVVPTLMPSSKNT